MTLPKSVCVRGHDLAKHGAVWSGPKRRCAICHSERELSENYARRADLGDPVESGRVNRILYLIAAIDREPLRWKRDALRAELEALKGSQS